MSLPISLFLTDFSKDRTPIPLLAMPDAGFGLDFPDPAFDELDASSDEAHQQAFAEGEAAARGQAESQLERLKVEHADTLAEARRQWTVEQASILGQQLTDGLAELEARITGALADVLQPVLYEAVRLKALDEMRATITTLLGGDEALPVRISGPEDLLEALGSAIGAASAVTLVPSDDIELTLTAGDTSIRSSVQAWADKVRDFIREA